MTTTERATATAAPNDAGTFIDQHRAEIEKYGRKPKPRSDYGIITITHGEPDTMVTLRFTPEEWSLIKTAVRPMAHKVRSMHDLIMRAARDGGFERNGV